MKEISTDYDFVQSIYSGGLAQKADASGIESLSTPERNVMLAWWAKGIIDNGGFAYLCETDADIGAISRAFFELGFVDAANACLASIEITQGGKVARKGTAGVKVVAIDCSDDSDPFKDCDAVVWRLGEEFDSAVALYIRKNSSYFSC